MEAIAIAAAATRKIPEIINFLEAIFG